MEAALVKAVARGDADPGRDLPAEDEGAQRRPPRGGGFLGQGQGQRRQDRAAMHDQFGMGIVEIQRMAGHPVDQRRIGGRQADLAADHGPLADGARNGFYAGQRLDGVRVSAAGQANAQRVDQQLSGPRRDRRRDILKMCGANEIGQLPRIAHVAPCSSCASRPPWVTVAMT